MLPQGHAQLGADPGGAGRVKNANTGGHHETRVFRRAAFAATLGALPASAAGVDKLYVLDCGHMSAPDQSRWSPGVNVGVPIELSDNCYLIHHAQGWFLWDTGLADALAANPDGVKIPQRTSG